MSGQINYRLGLDIGIASVGAALLADDRIIDLHVRTFEKAEVAKSGESLNKIRRDARLGRRRLRRRAFRLTRLRRVLHQAGLIESPEIESIGIVGVSPWDLRAKSLDQKLLPRELAAVLYHLIKHRGFQSNRKSEAKEDEKAGQMLSGIAENQKILQQKNYRTIGEMVAKDEHFALSKRNKGGSYSHTFGRQDLVNELNAIFEAQQKFSNEYATDELKKEAIQLILARKPALAGEALLEMVGECTFETKEYRAPKACFSSEKFVLLSKLNNLQIQTTSTSRSLTNEERQLILAMPFALTKVTYKQIRKKLELGDEDKFNLVSYFGSTDKDPENDTFFQAKHFHAIKKAYQNSNLTLAWEKDSQDPEKLDKLAYAQTVYKDDVSAREWLTEQGVETEVIEAVLNVSFSDFLRLSTKFINKVLPFLEEGQRYDEAVISAGYDHHSKKTEKVKSNYLPKIDKEDINNPVVYRSINQTRKLINAIVKKYGAPMSVHIELARDLNKSFKERQTLIRDQKANYESREKEQQSFVDLFGKEPNGYEILKMRLYREQSGKCAYSQKPIDLERLCEVGYVEVDHALPYSRSFDNSFTNKVLVFTSENRNKGNRTPYEYLGGKTNNQAWLQYEAWVKSTIKNFRKQQKLLRKNFDHDKAMEFRDRNLNDTRYAGRVIKNLIEENLQLNDESTSKRCVVVAGQLTAFLRGKWGLSKVREDGDKHHALDAAVVAACSHGMVKRLANYSKHEELEWAKRDFIDPETGEILDLAAVRELEDSFPTPWPHFRKELLALLSENPKEALKEIPAIDPARLETVQPIRVSRMPTRRSLGQAHQDTIRSVKLIEEKSLSSVKTALTNIKLKDLESIVGYEDIRNEVMFNSLRSRLEMFDDKPDKAFEKPFYKPCKANGFDPNIAKLDNFNGSPAPEVKTLRVTKAQRSGLPVRKGIADNGDMLRIDLFTKANKFYAIPIYVSDVVKDELPNKVASGKPESEWQEIDESYQFMFSIYPNDWLKISFKSKPSREGYYASFDRASAALNLYVHDRNQNIGTAGLIRGIGFLSATSIEKYHIDMLGKAYLAPWETRKNLK